MPHTNTKRVLATTLLMSMLVACSLGANHLTPSCAMEQSKQFNAQSGSAALHNLFTGRSYLRNLLVVSCFAWDVEVAAGQPSTCTPATVSPFISATSFIVSPAYDAKFIFSLGDVFKASVLAVVYEVPIGYSLVPSFDLGFDHTGHSGTCESRLRSGASMSIGMSFNSDIDVANLVAVSPTIIHTGKPSLFTFERALPRTVATSNWYDEVVIIRDHESCATTAPAKKGNFNPVRYLRGPDGKIRFDWDVTIVNSGYYVVCARFQGVPWFLDVAFIRAYGGNPLYFRATNVNRGTSIVGNTIDVTFFGTNMSTTADCAKMVLSTEPCSTSRTDVYGGSKPSCTAGAPPLRVGSGAGGWASMNGLMMMSWEATLTQVGGYRVCYRQGATGMWEDVVHYDELSSSAQNYFVNNATGGNGTNVTPGGPRPHWRETFSRSLSITQEREIPVTAVPVPTVAPGDILCNFTYPNGTNTYFACRANQTCGTTGPSCLVVATETAIPTQPAPTVPPGFMSCTAANGSAYFCQRNTTNCSSTGAMLCEVLNATTATAVPVSTMVVTTAAPITLDPSLQLCTWFNASAGANETFVCPALNTTCGAGDCVIVVESTQAVVTLSPATTAPPTTISPFLVACKDTFPNGTVRVFFCFKANETCGQAFGVCVRNVTDVPFTTSPPMTAPPTGFQLCNSTSQWWLCRLNQACGLSGECVTETAAAVPTPTPAPTTTVAPGSTSAPTTAASNTTTAPPTLAPDLQPCSFNGTYFACFRNESCGRGYCAAVTEAASTLAPTATAPPGYINCGFAFCPPGSRCGPGTCIAGTETATAVPQTPAPTPVPTTIPPNLQSCTYAGRPFYCLKTETCGNGDCIVSTATATATGVPQSRAPTTTVPPLTAPAGMQICHASADGTVVYFCPLTQICGQAGQCVVIQTETARPTATSIPDGYKVCDGGFLCNVSARCDTVNRVCILPTPATQTAAPVPPPATQDPNATQCTDHATGSVVFQCGPAAPVCCVGIRGCCRTGFTCGTRDCIAVTPPPTPAPATPVPPTTTLPPIPTWPPTPAPTTGASGTTAAPQPPCPTAPPSWQTFSPSADPVLTVTVGAASVPSDLLPSFAVLICVPTDALRIVTAPRRQATTKLTLRIDCDPTACNNVERMNYALFLFTQNPTAFAAAGIEGMTKNDADGNTITVASASDSDEGAAAAEKTKVVIIVAVCVIVLAVILAIVVVVKRRRTRDAGRHHMRFSLDADVARDENVEREADRRAELDLREGGPGGPDVDPMDDDGFNGSIASDTPLEMDDVDVVVDIVAEKRTSY